MDREKLTQKVVNNASCPHGEEVWIHYGRRAPGFGRAGHGCWGEILYYSFPAQGPKRMQNLRARGVLEHKRRTYSRKELIGEYLKGGDPLKVEVKKSASKLTMMQLYKKWEKWAEEQKLERITTKNMIGAVGLYFNLDKKTGGIADGSRLGELQERTHEDGQ